MSNTKWTAIHIPNLTHKVAIVTGGNSGLGYESVLAMAAKGAEVIMASRNLEKGQKAVGQIKNIHPEAKVTLMKLDLSDLESVKTFAKAFQTDYSRLDILLNNAGIMAVPEGRTVDGFERQFGTNHLGHFALTGLLLDLLHQTPESRIVNVASKAADSGAFDFDNLNREGNYSPLGAYGQSKLANVLFTFELQRKLQAANSSTVSIAAHPGGSNTNLADGAKINPIIRAILTPIFGLIAQSAAQGALPQLYASTAPEAKGGTYYGPDGFNELRGFPKEANIPSQALNRDWQRQLWEASEKLTGVTYQSLEPTS
ncbi:MAG: oxidoreductase [Bacteroidota bacterium]